MENKKTNKSKNSESSGKLSKKQEKQKQKTPEKPCITQESNTQNQNDAKKLEKELRRLEWEKKLAEQGGNKRQEEAGNLSKAQLRAKRREEQEGQRQLKNMQLESNIKDNINNEKPEENKETKSVTENKPSVRKDEPLSTKEVPHACKALSYVKGNKAVANLTQTPANVLDNKKIAKKIVSKPVLLVSHLEDSYKKQELNTNLLNIKGIHPEFIKLGIQFCTMKIVGSNLRCRALLLALIQLVRDLKPPENQEFCRYLESVLQNGIEYLQTFRAFSVSMQNAIRYFKIHSTKVDSELSDKAKRQHLENIINTYIRDEIDIAGKAISLKANEKIANGDIILTYGCSSLICKILLDALGTGKEFAVIVVDGGPLFEGRELLKTLTEAGVRCSYCLISAISFIMPLVSKVFLGTHALLANGSVISRIGTAQVAAVAQADKKPVLVCCETYKFCERTQTDSIGLNEIANSETLELLDKEKNGGRYFTQTKSNLSKVTKLNLLYDVTPKDLVTASITELGVLPCSSVPVILRIKFNEVF